MTWVSYLQVFSRLVIDVHYSNSTCVLYMGNKSLTPKNLLYDTPPGPI